MPQSICEAFCLDTPCTGLSGNVGWECGACDVAAACHPGAAGFIDQPSNQQLSAEEPDNEEPLATKNNTNAAHLDTTTHARHLLFATNNSGVARVSFNCAADGVAGVVVRDDGTVWRVQGAWALGPRFEMVPLPEMVAARMTALCTRIAATESLEDDSWPLCVQSDPTGERPKGMLNRTCAFERHRAYWGERFLPGERIATRTNAGHLRRFGLQGQRRVALPEVSGCLDAHTFFRDYVDRHRPVVMRGCANTSNALALSEWDDDHLGRIAPMHATERDSCSEDFASFLSSYTNGSHRYRRCNNLPSELLRELTVPPMLDVIDAPTKLQFENVLLWMHGGTSDQMSRLHFDMNGVLLTQLDGRKNFLAVDPIDGLNLYADFNEDPFVNTSPLNEKAVDLIQHPRAANVTLHAATTKPGDVIYLPTRWWHVARSPIRKGEPPQRNLAFTIEFSTAQPKHTLPAPPSYVHRPAFGHELLLWALSHRAKRKARVSTPGTDRDATVRRTMDQVDIRRQTGSCSVAK